MTSTGIHPPFEAFYIEAMLWHTASAGQSIEDVSKWLRHVHDDDPRALDLSKGALFERLQNILHQAGCVSRYFFPVGQKVKPLHAERGARLREAFSIAEDNPLADRDLRNALEHFDERLDRYVADHQVGQFIPDHVDIDRPQSEVPLHVFKGFYVSSLTFVLLGVEYPMEPIVNEMLRIHNTLIDCSKSTRWNPSSTRCCASTTR
jgi:hypothetical protein